MSDTGNIKTSVSTEDEESEERFSNLPVVRVKKSLSDLRSPRQKFCKRWEIDFPWLKADKVDESLGYCTVCEKNLVCKKSHLERHEKSFKHQRHQGFESLDSCDASQPTAVEFLECGKREPEDEEDKLSGDADGDRLAKNDMDPIQRTLRRTTRRQSLLAKSQSPIKHRGNSRKVPTTKLDRLKLLKRIDRERHELNEYYYARRKQISPAPVPQPPRDSFDLFFESVSASVKTLPPKLAAEVKSQVSQIIAEFELRAICEREALNNATGAAEPAVVVASTTREPTSEVAVEPTTVASPSASHIVYTFHSKFRK